MTTAWKQVVRMIANGMSVSADVANRATSDLSSRTDFLRELMESVQAGHATCHRGAPLSGCDVGDPVYWSVADDAYKPAQATYTTVNGIVVPSAASQVLGVVIARDNDVGDVCLFGYVDTTDLGSSLAAGLGATPTPGIYYLSSTASGGLTQTKPPLAIPVLWVLDATHYWVNPMLRGGLTEHQHYAFYLTAADAAAADDPGWLAEDHANFTGMTKPVGATHGYNIVGDAAVNAAWPAFPSSGARVFVDGHLQGADTVVVNDYGVWWMDASPPVAGEDLQLFFVQLTGLTADAFVTNLTTTLPLEIKDCTTQEDASKGDLVITLADYVATTLAAGTVMPDTGIQAVTRTNKITGPVVSGICGSGRLSVTSSTGSSILGADGNTYKTGGLVLAVTDSAESREGMIDIVALTDAGETKYQDIPYYVLPKSLTSSIRCKASLPMLDIPSGSTLQLRLWVLGEAAGNLPPLTLGYRQLAHSVAAFQDIDAADTELDAIDLGALVSPYQYIAVLSTPAIEVSAGDCIYFNIEREYTDAYAANVGILNMRWVITPPAE